MKKSSKHSAKKTEELILYVCSKLQNEKTFGATVLNKVLFYIDASSYVKTGNQVSTLSYIKQDFGVTPNPKEFFPLRDNLISSGKLEFINIDFFGKTQKKPTTTHEINVKYFTQLEISEMQNVIDYFRDACAAAVSHFNHKELGWQLAKSKEKIPMYTYLLSYTSPSEDDIKWAKSSIKKYSK